MRLTGSQIIAAPPDRVWEALIDPDLLKTLIPGCRSMSGNPASGYDVAAERSVGGVDVRMTGRIDLSDIRPGEGVLLHAAGEAGAFGGAKGTARIVLRPEAAGTRLGWDLDAQTEGRLAGFPRILVEAVASRVAHGFVERFAAAIEGREVKKGWLSRLTGR
jgi:carbon monoxide dehydrogenase subunit G